MRQIRDLVSVPRHARARLLYALPLIAGCTATMPSAKLQSEIKLPVPAAKAEASSPFRFSRENHGERYRITPRSLIAIAFHGRPSIKSSFQRFKVEEARYDFFYASNDSLTPRFRTSNNFGETRARELVTREREHRVEVGVEKLFFDTTELNMAMGINAGALDEALGNHPFAAVDLRYPLWVSREKLERTSEDIFRRNEVDDAQLAYIQEVRESLEQTMFSFYEVVDLRSRMDSNRRWREDLELLRGKLEGAALPNRISDQRRLEAEIAKVVAGGRDFSGRFDVQVERLKAACGLPFHSTIEPVDEPFNPFAGITHERLFELSTASDPEIATLRNSQRNAEVQLDLARRGRWDVALLAGGITNLEGAGEDESMSDWSVALGLDVSAVDARVTESLARQAEANIARFKQAIAARENDIFVDTFEPLIRIETLSKSRDELIANLPRYQDDYTAGVDAYQTGTLNIDDLLKRRENVFDQEQEIIGLTFLVGANVAELCAATGKFFELLDEPLFDSTSTGNP